MCGLRSVHASFWRFETNKQMPTFWLASKPMETWNGDLLREVLQIMNHSRGAFLTYSTTGGGGGRGSQEPHTFENRGDDHG